jgi:cytochrome P450/NADPH-cytochrome P450 reductase
MVGAGTGIAPYRGFLQERAAQQKAGRTVARSLLFFGCRHPAHDNIYRCELEDYQQRGLVDIVTAFSRETQTKVYVQDRLREHASEIWKALEEGGTIYVCGDAAGMAAGVRRALIDVVAEQAGISSDQAGEFLDRLAAEDRYLLDVWAS